MSTPLSGSPLLTQLPQPAERRIALHITRDAKRHLRAGHPWLFTDSIVRQSHEGQPGDLAVVFDQKRRFLAIGLYDPTSPIRLRVLHQGAPTTIDQAWFSTKLAKIMARRAPLLADPRTTGYRLVYGENDGLPGCVIDCYATTLVMKLYTAAWIPHLAMLVTALQGHLSASAIDSLVLRMSRNIQQQCEDLAGLTDGMTLLGTPPDAPVLFLENGLWFEAEPIKGQKTGFFLDQRENRARVERLATGKRVLNVFAYNGGFSLYAARGGARAVTSLDISEPALHAAERNFALNREDPAVAKAAHKILSGDAFQLMATLAQEGVRYDLIVIDPPAFAKRQSEREGALRAYAQLTRLGLNLLENDGTIVLASCSSRISAAEFVANAQATAAAMQRPLQIFDQTGHALDHPIGFPEGAYLKCLYARA